MITSDEITELQAINRRMGPLGTKMDQLCDLAREGLRRREEDKAREEKESQSKLLHKLTI